MSKHFPQALADELLAMEKHRVDEKVWNHPDHGDAVTIPLQSADGREEFLLDVKRYRADILRHTYNKRGRQSVILARIDLRGPIHENPDGEVIPPPHIHLHREGFGDKWAFPLSPEHFRAPEDAKETFNDFLLYCNVTRPPRMQERCL